MSTGHSEGEGDDQDHTSVPDDDLRTYTMPTPVRDRKGRMGDALSSSPHERADRDSELASPNARSEVDESLAYPIDRDTRTVSPSSASTHLDTEYGLTRSSRSPCGVLQRDFGHSITGEQASNSVQPADVAGLSIAGVMDELPMRFLMAAMPVFGRMGPAFAAAFERDRLEEYSAEEVLLSAVRVFILRSRNREILRHLTHYLLHRVQKRSLWGMIRTLLLQPKSFRRSVSCA